MISPSIPDQSFYDSESLSSFSWPGWWPRVSLCVVAECTMSG